MPDRSYTIANALLISGPDLTPKQADTFWLDLLELADQHRVKLHGTKLVEVENSNDCHNDSQEG